MVELNVNELGMVCGGNSCETSTLWVAIPISVAFAAGIMNGLGVRRFNDIVPRLLTAGLAMVCVINATMIYMKNDFRKSALKCCSDADDCPKTPSNQLSTDHGNSTE